MATRQTRGALKRNPKLQEKNNKANAEAKAEPASGPRPTRGSIARQSDRTRGPAVGGGAGNASAGQSPSASRRSSPPPTRTNTNSVKKSPAKAVSKKSPMVKDSARAKAISSGSKSANKMANAKFDAAKGKSAGSRAKSAVSKAFKGGNAEKGRKTWMS